MNRLDSARKFRKEFEASKKINRKYITVAEIPVEEMEEYIDIYEDFKVGETVTVGDIRKHEGMLYEVIQAHTTQADWLPATVPALWKAITPATTDEGTEIVPNWKQPTGAHDAYALGAKVLFEGKVYESLIANNAYSPTAYPRGWKLIE